MNDLTTPLSLENVSVNAIKVVNRLVEHGYEAYLVGGCIRDLMLGATPKDFDVATSAHPEEVRELFRNSRLIGKRFRIVHVRFGREIVEVSTFRGPHKDDHEDASGQVRDDNVYGTFEEDTFRRDFAMNALYLRLPENEVIDLAGGIDDIKDKRIRLIGEPDQRFREDPVRMLRAVRFRAKLGFDIEDHCGDAIRDLGYLLQDIPPARLFEEVLKLMMTGHAVRTYECMKEYELFGWLFPSARRASEEDEKADRLITAALASTDRRIENDQPVTPAFIFAALLWYPFVIEKARLENEEKATSVTASHEAAGTVLANQQLFTSIPRRFSGPMRDIWNLQFRLPMRFGNKPDSLMAHKRFRAAYDFLLLREESGEKLGGIGEWWTQYQEADEEGRNKLKQQAGKSGGGGNRKRRRRRKRRPEHHDRMTPHPTFP